MGKREQIDLADYRQPAAEAYADDVVDATAYAIYSADFVNGLIREAYLAGAASIAPEGATARWEYSILPDHRQYPHGRYRQKTRAVNMAGGYSQKTEVVRRRIIATPWENDTGQPVEFVSHGGSAPGWLITARNY